MTERAPLKILCIHGYRQNEATFRQKLGAFRKACGPKRAEFVFIDAPHRVPENLEESASKEDGREQQRGWWFSVETDRLSFNALESSNICPGFDQSLRTIEDAERTLGPFDGVLGFSQGAAMVGLYLATKRETSFKFVVYVASFRSKSSAHDSLYEKKISIPSLHVFGDSDAVIPKPMSLEFLEYHENPRTLNHSGGHFLPTAGPQKKVFNAFLDEMLELLRR